MDFVADENLPQSFVKELRSSSHGVVDIKKRYSGKEISDAMVVE